MVLGLECKQRITHVITQMTAGTVVEGQIEHGSRELESGDLQ
jgi:hypothetical protein